MKLFFEKKIRKAEYGNVFITSSSFVEKSQVDDFYNLRRIYLFETSQKKGKNQTRRFYLGYLPDFLLKYAFMGSEPQDFKVAENLKVGGVLILERKVWDIPGEYE